MDEKLAFQLRQITKYLGKLRDISETPREEFLLNSILQSATERYLHLCIESCINTGNRLISVLQVENRLDAPKTYADVFRELEKLKIIDDIVPSMVEMTKFCNRLVHIYWDVSPETIYSILQNNLADIDTFTKQVANYIQDNKL